MPQPPFPSALLDWAGHRKGGVRRLFYSGSGRPSGNVIYTNLLGRLKEWSRHLGEGRQAPRVVLLVGGPGNGKTEAVEFTVEVVDSACRLDGKLTSAFTAQFMGSNDKPAPRLAQVDLASISDGRFPMHMAIVQDASAVDHAVPSETAAGWLVRDLAQFAFADCGGLYLACVNRGVLDDALIHAIDTQQRGVQSLLETVTQSVGMGRDVPDCWPLDGYPNVAVWPMDVESLVGVPADPLSPTNQLLAIATKEAQWPVAGTCAAGEHCPFCSNRSALADDNYRRSFLQILRWYELATGKRWSFRDLFSLVSYVLAGVPPENGEEGAYNPCKSAAHLWELWGKQGTRQESLRLAAPFLLVASQYQHALFGDWSKADTKRIRASLKALQLDAEPGLKGLYWFLARPRGSSLPATLAQQLTVLCDVLDPALADPDTQVFLSTRRAVNFRDIDARFSQSVSEGYRFIKRSNCLTPLENHLMELLEQSDAELTKEETERRDPVSARYLRTVVRDFSCRLMRRSLGARSGVVRDADILADYEKVVGGDAELINQAVNQITNLLNTNEKFTVSLSTTFGEPTPSPERMATLRTDKQKVTSPPVRERAHPAQPIRFLSVGARPQHIPLTYELFRSIRGLVQGLVPASLPRSVVALLDTTRARMAGSIVRDEDMLNGSHITLGSSKQGIARQVGKFVVVGD